MSRKFTASIAAALSVGALAIVAEAQQHRATRLGNPATRFAKPLKKPDDLRVMLRAEKMKADVAAVLNELGYAGDPADIDRAAATADIVEIQIPSGTRLPFMAARKNGKPYAMRDVLWAGRRPIDAYGFEFTSKCQRYRLVTPKACSNFWLEDLGKDTSEACQPKKLPPVVSLSGASSACVTQPVDFTVTVQNPPADNRVVLSVNGKEAATGTLSNGTYTMRFPGAQQPGRYEVQAVSGGQTATAVVDVKACVPTCGITVSPNPARAGKPITVDVSGSRVAAGVAGGVKSVKVEVVQKGNVVQTIDMPAPNFVRDDVVVRKGGMTTLRAVATDEAGQASTNLCEAQIDVKGGIPLYVSGYFGKERLTHDDAEDHDELVPFVAFSQCAPLVGFDLGIQPMIGDNTALDAAVGFKFPVDDDDEAHSSLFGNVAINRVLSKGFVGAGVSFWDIGKDSGGVGPLVQGGFDLDADGKWQIVAQARTTFSGIDDIDNNYQLWGGIRFRPNAFK
jgi:hypothetical protein